MPAPEALARVTAAPVSRAAISAARASSREWTTISPKPAEMDGDVDHAVGEAPLVVVPGEDAAEPLVDDLGLGHIEGRAVRVVVEVDRHELFLRDAEDA